MRQLIVAVAILAVSGDVLARSTADTCDSSEGILMQALEIAYTEDPPSKIDKAIDFMTFVNAMPADELALLDDKAIQGIALLLHDSEYWVKIYAAMTLGIIGPKARMALPELEAMNQTLVEPRDPDDVVASSIDGKAAITAAIQSINGVSTPPSASSLKTD